jgi:hypothetical protein
LSSYMGTGGDGTRRWDTCCHCRCLTWAVTCRAHLGRGDVWMVSKISERKGKGTRTLFFHYPSPLPIVMLYVVIVVVVWLLCHCACCRRLLWLMRL